ncbi:unnamed protein product [Trichogramma brassicae]|uniref:Nucleoporin Nup54 alpha-helical domain-containing protein n=1 Tax=Trichogramma brassicae TaxID=86971 RepID=A0A6H5JAW3_9HYME|nr:unnamed protein product [Trichogramma brassicae]
MKKHSRRRVKKTTTPSHAPKSRPINGGGAAATSDSAAAAAATSSSAQTAAASDSAAAAAAAAATEGFGAKPAATTASTGFGGFGTGNAFSSFGSGLTQQQQVQPQQQQQQQVQSNANAISEALYNAVFNCQLFNDERDNTIARWNLIQALWGTGKAYYSAAAPPIELNQENPLCRFKAIGYSRMPENDNNDGLVVLCFAKKEQELKDGRPQFIASLNQILGNKPNLTVTVDSTKPVGESKKKFRANELYTYFTQGMQKQQLTQIGVENIFPQVKLDPAQIKEYMDNPPCSIDPRLWKQAQLDNPNPENYIPVPMIEEETGRHRAFLDMVAEDIQGLQRQHIATQARLKEHRRTLLELQHRVLSVLVRQETSRKVGFSLQPEEETLTNKFEAMHSQISAPTQFKGRISEMLSQLRMRRHTENQSQERYTMDPMAQDDIKSVSTSNNFIFKF